jgi:hypothetical protein
MTLKNNVDAETNALLSYGEGKTAVFSMTMDIGLENEDAWIFGEKGSIHLPSCVFVKEAELLIDGKEADAVKPSGKTGYGAGNGYNYIADAVMDDLREGRLENARYPLAESLSICRTMDMIRHQNNFYFPGEKK